MHDKIVSKFAKNGGESEMSTTALVEGKEYYNALMDAEYKGRKDKNGSARGRLAARLGVSETKLLRLEYKLDEMKDIGGELYRRLRLHYEQLVEANKKAADSYREARLELRKSHAADLASDEASLASADAGDRTEKETMK